MILNLQAFNCCSTSSAHQQCSKPCFSGNVWDRKSKLTTIGKKIFRSDSKSVTTDCHMAETEINGIHVCVIDSPSLMIKLDHIISSCFKNKNSQKTRKNKFDASFKGLNTLNSVFLLCQGSVTEYNN